MGERLYPIAQIGDVIGTRTIVALVPRGRRGRSDERVRWQCSCGLEGESYMFNLREHNACHHVGGRVPSPASTRRTIQVQVCHCGHSSDDHRPRGGECLDDDCDCVAFERDPEAT